MACTVSADRKHYPLVCPDCDGFGCSYCDGRGYYEICGACREPIGNRRRKWKRGTHDRYGQPIKT